MNLNAFYISFHNILTYYLILFYIYLQAMLLSPYEEQLYGPQSYGQSLLRQPSYRQQLYEQQLHEQQLYEQQLYEQQLYEQQLYEQHLYEQQLYEQQLYEQPIYKHLTYSQPSYGLPQYGKSSIGQQWYPMQPKYLSYYPNKRNPFDSQVEVPVTKKPINSSSFRNVKDNADRKKLSKNLIQQFLKEIMIKPLAAIPNVMADSIAASNENPPSSSRENREITTLRPPGSKTKRDTLKPRLYFPSEKLDSLEPLENIPYYSRKRREYHPYNRYRLNRPKNYRLIK
jgi:hypothetical protein